MLPKVNNCALSGEAIKKGISLKQAIMKEYRQIPRDISGAGHE
jgi:hypothetical protein